MCGTIPGCLCSDLVSVWEWQGLYCYCSPVTPDKNVPKSSQLKRAKWLFERLGLFYWQCWLCRYNEAITHHNHPSKGSSSPREWGSASTVHWHSPTRAVDLSCYLAFGSWVITKYFYNPNHGLWLPSAGIREMCGTVLRDEGTGWGCKRSVQILLPDQYNILHLITDFWQKWECQMYLEKWELQILLTLRIYAYTINIHEHTKCVSSTLARTCPTWNNLLSSVFLLMIMEWQFLHSGTVYSNYLLKNLDISK